MLALITTSTEYVDLIHKYRSIMEYRDANTVVQIKAVRLGQESAYLLLRLVGCGRNLICYFIR